MRMRSTTQITRLTLAALLLFAAVGLTGCYGYSNSDYIDLIEQWIADWEGEDSSEEDVAEESGVELALTFPAGSSPKVFVAGWVFGARCVAQTEDGEVNYSDKVKWSGTGSFSPDTGRISRPVFGGAGANEIRLSVEIDGEIYERTFTVEAVSTAQYAAVGDSAKCDADSHGSPADPMRVDGPITTGSPNVFVDGRPAARVGDVGVHAACSGPNTFEITGGDGSVLINGRAAAKVGSTTRHCGGVGTITSGSPGG